MTMTPRQDDEPLETELELTADVVQEDAHDERPTSPVQKEQAKPNKKMQRHPEDRLIVSCFFLVPLFVLEIFIRSQRSILSLSFF